MAEAYKDFFWGFLGRDYYSDHEIIEGKPNDEATTHDGLAKRLGYGYESEEAEWDGYVRFFMPLEGQRLIMSGFIDKTVLKNMAEFMKDKRVLGPVEIELVHMRDEKKNQDLTFDNPEQARKALLALSSKTRQFIEW